MASPASKSNYILKVTLIVTANPVVNRFLNVPADLQFIELHETIVAAFGWNATGLDPCTMWMFRVSSEDPWKTRRNIMGGEAIYYTHPQAGYGVKPPLHHTTTTLMEMFGTRDGTSGGARFWTYEYNVSTHCHLIEVMIGASSSDQDKGKISCSGARGHIERLSWQLHSFGFGTAKDVTAVGTSAYNLDIMEIGARLKPTQMAYEERLADELSVAGSKRRGNSARGSGGSSNAKKEPPKKRAKRKAYVVDEDDEMSTY